jgi:hypothetical protein
LDLKLNLNSICRDNIFTEQIAGYQRLFLQQKDLVRIPKTKIIIPKQLSAKVLISNPVLRMVNESKKAGSAETSFFAKNSIRNAKAKLFKNNHLKLISNNNVPIGLCSPESLNGIGKFKFNTNNFGDLTTPKKTKSKINLKSYSESIINSYFSSSMKNSDNIIKIKTNNSFGASYKVNSYNGKSYLYQ